MSVEPTTEAGKALLSDYFHPDAGEVDAWSAGGLEARVVAIEAEARAPLAAVVAAARQAASHADHYFEHCDPSSELTDLRDALTELDKSAKP